MSIWLAVSTAPTICGLVGAPPPFAFALAGCSATANMIVAAAHKALRRLCIPVFDILIPFDVLISFDILISPYVSLKIGSDLFPSALTRARLNRVCRRNALRACRWDHLRKRSRR